MCACTLPSVWSLQEVVGVREQERKEKGGFEEEEECAAGIEGEQGKRVERMADDRHNADTGCWKQLRNQTIIIMVITNNNAKKLTKFSIQVC